MQRPARLFCAISFTTTTGPGSGIFGGVLKFFLGLHGGRQVDFQVENLQILWNEIFGN